MRIEHGSYVLTSRAQIEMALTQQSKKIELLQSQLNLAQQWARDQLSIHQPYVNRSDIDMSGHEPEKMAQALAAKIAKNIWCARCSNPWPCKHITHLRFLRDITRRNDAGSLRVIADQMNAIEPPKLREGQLDVGL